MAKKGETYYRYSYEELSAFCLQISLLLGTAVPLEGGLAIMAEDAASQNEKNMLLYMAEGMELGGLFFKVMEDTGVFPVYVMRMAKLGQQTGTMDQVVKSLSNCYKKKHRLLRAIKDTVIYPVIVMIVFLVVLLVLFSRIMPVPNKIYEQLGAQMPPVATSAMRLGGWLNGAALTVGTVLALALCRTWTASKFGKHFILVERFVNSMKGRGKIALVMANRRFAVVLALILESGMELEKGMDLAEELVENGSVAIHIGKCSEQLQAGGSYYQTMKNTGLFSGSYVQMIKVGTRSSHLSSAMDEISQDYEEMADTVADDMTTRSEPTIAAILAILVGLILLPVILPLVGILFAIR